MFNFMTRTTKCYQIKERFVADAAVCKVMNVEILNLTAKLTAIIISGEHFFFLSCPFFAVQILLIQWPAPWFVLVQFPNFFSLVI